MNFTKYLRSVRAQAIAEYVAIFIGIIAAIVAISLLSRMQGTLRDYADRQIKKITK
ncbi:MAG: hypothetical protein NC826_05045 [Candidatus Omnitrophica bacterium]|nr:hypothetical protein [Candidatus Omnitrophota bacterium]